MIIMTFGDEMEVEEQLTWGMVCLLADIFVFSLTLANVSPVNCTVEMQSGNPS